MKQRIRLTESDLHKVITESVKHIISELDWKTYANAARKASFGDDRMSEFADKARDEFNKKYSMNTNYTPKNGVGITNASIDGIDSDDIFKKGIPNFCVDDDELWEYGDIPLNYYERMSDIPTDEWVEDYVDDNDGTVKEIHRKSYDDRSFSYTPILYSKYTGEYLDKDKLGWYRQPDYGNEDVRNLPNYKELKQKYKDANDDFENYMKNRYKYSKGKGWHLKNKMDESIHRAIRKVLR